MKYLIACFALVLSGCQTVAPKNPADYPKFIQNASDEWYDYEIWERVDGSRYIKRGNIKMDMP